MHQLLYLKYFLLYFCYLLNFFFIIFLKKEELNLLKANGLSNLKIIRTLFLTSLTIGIFTVLIFYNTVSKLKFFYTDIKNNFSNDNKYLAVVTDSGLWLKDEINDTTLIIKANYIQDNFLINVIINQFDNNFDLKKLFNQIK